MPIDPGSAAAVLSSLKTAQEMAKALIGIRDEAKARAAVIDLQQVIIDAQGSALEAQQREAALLEDIRQLRQQIAEADDWAKTVDAHELVELHPGSRAYVPVGTENHFQADVYLCPTCFAKKQAIPLQGNTAREYGLRILKCPECQTEVHHSDAGKRPSASYAVTGRRRGTVGSR